jgi:hypothetical protein
LSFHGRQARVHDVADGERGKGGGVGQPVTPPPDHVQVGPDEDEGVTPVHRPRGGGTYLERREGRAEPSEGRSQLPRWRIGS